MDINRLFFLFYLIILATSVILSSSKRMSNDINSLINDYYSINPDIEIKNIQLDEFVTGNINNTSNEDYYNLTLLTDFEEIYFDFQSEYGCLYIDIEENILVNKLHNFKFCSEGNNNIFSLNKNDIDNIIINKQNDTNEGLNIIIKVGFDSDIKINFIYSLKLSLRKSEINIFEINSEHKYLCKTKKLIDDKYRCLFFYTNNDINNNFDNLIIYSKSENDLNEFVNIYADYINKTEFNDSKIDELINKIPNNESSFNNYNTEKYFISIPNITENKYIFISIESYTNMTIEVLAQKIINNNEEIKIPKENDIQIFSINNNFSLINLNFENLLGKEITLSFFTLYGKASILLGNDEFSKYIIDTIENKLFFMINAEQYKQGNIFKIKINNLEEEDESQLGFLFYISFSSKSQNVLKKLSFGKSSKLLYTNNFEYPIIMYQQIQKNNIFSYYINLQLLYALLIYSLKNTKKQIYFILDR